MNTAILKMSDLDLAGKRVLVREDLNVPLKDGKVSSDARLRAALPTLQQALAADAQLIVMSHLGRPVEGEPSEEYSMRPVVDYLAAALNVPVRLCDSLDDVEISPGEVVVLENVRFNVGEKANV